MRFAVVGDCALDIVIVPDRRRRPGGDVAARIRLGPGGQAANVAVRLARLGRAVRLVAPLADDLAGSLLRDALEQEGVAVAEVLAPRSAAVAVLLDAGGERTMLSDRQSLGAPAALAALAGAEWVHCSGYALLDDGGGDALAAGLRARPASVRLSVGGGSLPPERGRVARFRVRLRSAGPQLCILSRDEAAALVGRPSRSASDSAARLAALADVVVVTAGADGSAATLAGGLLTSPPADVREPIVDATGAGDAYAAALIARLASAPWPPRPGELRRAMAAAGRLGARVARVAGAQGRVAGERRRGPVSQRWPVPLRVSDEVRDALADGRPVVALESSLIAQGLLAPHNVDTARAAEAAVRDEGAVPATTAVDDGWLLLGVPPSVIERLADPAASAAKAGSRDLGPLIAAGRLASTTVSASIRIAHLGGVRLFATGGIGGVHRRAATSFDVSSDIDELAATPVAVVCSGAKSILDLPATLELLETRRIPVVGLGCDELPAFYAMSSGLRLAHRVDTPEAAAATVIAHLGLPGAGGILLVQPPPAELALDAGEVEAWIAEATSAVAASELRGGEVTPFVLSHIARASGGRALAANVGLIVNNARMAARVAVAEAQLRRGASVYPS